jgi:peptidoglycan/LPS O-acetylase OafA/YrhL
MTRSYIPQIDGLRAIAVLAVVAFHATPQYVPGGFLGVDVFFVISGFLISGIIFDGLSDGSFSLGTFYARRIRRIFPALLVVLAATFAAGWWLLFPLDVIRLGNQVVYSAAFLANIYFWTQAGYFSPDANTYPLLHLWSLGVEEQFYIFWPITLMTLWRWPRLIFPAVLGLAFTSFLSCVLTADSATAFFSPLARWWELMIGAALAWFARSNVRPPSLVCEMITCAGLIAVFASFVMTRESGPGWRTLLPTVGTALVLYGAPGSRFASTALSVRPLVFVGLISYPLYLWHWPIFWVGRTIDLPWSVATVTALIATSFVLAWLTYEFVEKPIKHGSRAMWLRRPVVLIFGMLFFAGIGKAATFNGNLGRWPSEVLTLLTYKFDIDNIYHVGKCHLLPTQGPSSFSKECLGERTPNARHVVLWGDSSATALEPGLKLENNGNFYIDELTASACPPFIGDYKPLSERPHCSDVNAYALDYIKASKPDIVILSFAPNTETDIPRQTGVTIAALRGIGITTIVVVGPPPLWPKSFPETILREYKETHTVPQTIRLAEAARSISAIDHQVGLTTSAAGAIYVSAYRQLCVDEMCEAMSDGEPTVWDRFHMTVSGSAIVARAIYRALTP